MKNSWMLSALAALGIASAAFANGTSSAPCASPPKPNFTVVPFEMNNGSNVVSSEWKNGLGCPKDATNSGPDPVYGCQFAATVAEDPNNPGSIIPGPVVDSQSVNDAGNQGLALSKTVGMLRPDAKDAAAGAELKGVRGYPICEVGYDARKPLAFGAGVYGPAGSHCGARSPRFEITTKDTNNRITTSYTYGDGCLLPPPLQKFAKNWQRLRWSPEATTVCPNGAEACLLACATTDPAECAAGAVVDIYGQRVERIRIMFDEGPDEVPSPPPGGGSPDAFAFAILDNIDVNGKLVGSGSGKASYDDEDHGEGGDGKGHDCRFRGSSSHPEEAEFEYNDSSSGKKVQGVNGARSMTYSNGPLGEKCVNIVGDALVNGSAGYLYNFVACDLYLLGGVGTFAITVTGGPLGSLPYQQAASMTSGFVSIHE